MALSLQKIYSRLKQEYEAHTSDYRKRLANSAIRKEMRERISSDNHDEPRRIYKEASQQGRILAVAIAKNDVEDAEVSLNALAYWIPIGSRIITSMNSKFHNGRMFVCECCNKWALVVAETARSGMQVCAKCSRERLMTASHCGHREARVSTLILDNGTATTICGYCGDAGYFYDGCSGRYHESRPHILAGYHSSRDFLKKIGSDIPGLQNCGFELEFAPVPGGDRQPLIKSLLDCKDFVAGVERDGSVADIDGAEIVSHYGSIDEVLKGAAKVSAILGGRSISHNTDCCGLHVSLDRRGLRNNQIARFVVFWNSPRNEKFLHAFARRKCNHFCTKDPEKGETPPSTLVDGGYADRSLWTSSSRYETVNLRNSERIEVRAFRGTTNKNTIAACISLTVWSMAYCVHGHPKTLRYQEFLEWCHSAKMRRGRRVFRPTAVLEYAKSRGLEVSPKKEAVEEAPAPDPSPPVTSFQVQASDPAERIAGSGFVNAGSISEWPGISPWPVAGGGGSGWASISDGAGRGREYIARAIFEPPRNNVGTIFEYSVSPYRIPPGFLTSSSVQ